MSKCQRSELIYGKLGQETAVKNKKQLQSKFITRAQLYNYIKYIRKEKLGSTVKSLNDHKDWANARTSIPEEDEKMFVGAFQYQANCLYLVFFV